MPSNIHLPFSPQALTVINALNFSIGRSTEMLIPRRDKLNRRIRRHRIHYRIFACEIAGFLSMRLHHHTKTSRLPWNFETVKKVALSLLHTYLNHLAANLTKLLRAIRTQPRPSYRCTQNKFPSHTFSRCWSFSTAYHPLPTKRHNHERIHPPPVRGHDVQEYATIRGHITIDLSLALTPRDTIIPRVSNSCQLISSFNTFVPLVNTCSYFLESNVPPAIQLRPYRTA